MQLAQRREVTRRERGEQPPLHDRAVQRECPEFRQRWWGVQCGTEARAKRALAADDTQVPQSGWQEEPP